MDISIYIYIYMYVHISADHCNTKCLSVVPRGSSVQSCLEHVLGYLPEAYILSVFVVSELPLTEDLLATGQPQPSGVFFQLKPY